MHFKRLLIKIQESSPKAFKIAKTPEPGPHAVMAHALMRTRLEYLQQHIFFKTMGTLSKMTNNFKILPKALIKIRGGGGTQLFLFFFVRAVRVSKSRV